MRAPISSGICRGDENRPIERLLVEREVFLCGRLVTETGRPFCHDSSDHGPAGLRIRPIESHRLGDCPMQTLNVVMLEDEPIPGGNGILPGRALARQENISYF